jgi:hypothetical protein
VATLANSGLWWAADNDALRGVQPDELLALWDRIAAADRTRLLWVTAPDAVIQTEQGPRGSWEGTLWLFRCWLPALRKRGLPPAIVAQDGATEDTVPWDDISALFVGGSTAWKLSEAAATLIRAARARGVWVHVGRLNTVRRWRHFEPLEIDSFDGTQFSRYAATYLPRWLTMLELRQHALPEAAPVGAPPRTDPMAPGSTLEWVEV